MKTSKECKLGLMIRVHFIFILDVLSNIENSATQKYQGLNHEEKISLKFNKFLLPLKVLSIQNHQANSHMIHFIGVKCLDDRDQEAVCEVPKEKVVIKLIVALLLALMRENEIADPICQVS